MKNANNLIKILNSQPPLLANKIRAEYTKSAYDKYDGVDKIRLQECIRIIAERKKTKIHNLGPAGAIELFAAIAQKLDEIDWPKRDGNPG